VSKSEPEITKYDTIAGDGDAGQTAKAMADGVANLLKSGKIDEQNVTASFLDIARVIEKEGDGTSGGSDTRFKLTAQCI
jgi:dihydroxyacetone kinase